MIYIYLAIAAGIIGVATIMMLTNSSASLEVDAFRDQADVAGFYRVMLKNNGERDISNIIVDFGNHNITIPQLRSKESIIVSPREMVTSEYVIIKAEPDILIQKEFRSAPRMPGMIGGMG